MRYFFLRNIWYVLPFIVIVMLSCNMGTKKTSGVDRIEQAGDPLAPPKAADTSGLVILSNDSVTSSSPSKNEDFRISPGKKIGKINIGMQQELIEQVLGKADSTDAAMGTFVYTWIGNGKPYKTELNVVTSYADADMKHRSVKMIRTTSPYFMTGNGMGVQKNLAEIKKYYPLVKIIKTYPSANHQASTDIYADVSAGILFECLSNDQQLCVGVQVFEPGQLPGVEF
jgi:hypothetical protein